MDQVPLLQLWSPVTLMHMDMSQLSHTQAWSQQKWMDSNPQAPLVRQSTTLPLMKLSTTFSNIHNHALRVSDMIASSQNYLPKRQVENGLHMDGGSHGMAR